MIHFGENYAKRKLWAILMLILISMALPLLAQAKNPVNKKILSKPKLSTPAPTAAPSSAPSVAPTAVNLRVTTFQTSTRSVVAGTSLDVETTVKNTGINSSGRFMVKFYIARDEAGNRSATLIRSMPAFGLSRNATKNFDTSLRIPSNQSSGVWKLVARVEQSGTNPVKDSRARSLEVTPLPRPRLRVTILSISPERPMKGEFIRISVKIQNNGNAKAENIKLFYKFYQSCASINTIGDFIIQTIPRINSGSSIIMEAQKRIRLNAPSGNRAIKATVKIDGAVMGGDCKSIRIMDGNMQDLTVDLFAPTSTTLPITVKPGDTVQVQGRIKNIGTAASAKARFYYFMGGSSATATIPISPHRINVREIEPGSSRPSYPQAKIIELTIPEDAQPGRAYLKGMVTVIEGEELNLNNNQKGFYITIAEPDKPDLVVSRLSMESTTIQAGNRTLIHCSAKNIGPGTSGRVANIGIYISNNSTLDSSDRLYYTIRRQPTIPVGSDQIVPSGDLSPGRSFGLVVGFDPPGDLLPGTHYIIAKADKNNDIDEANENNNIKVILFRIRPRPAIRVE